MSADLATLMYKGVRVSEKCWRGTYALLDERLRHEGFRESSKALVGEIENRVYRKDSKVAVLTLVIEGQHARRVNIDLGGGLTKTRTAGTPNIYELCYL